MCPTTNCDYSSVVYRCIVFPDEVEGSCVVVLRSLFNRSWRSGGSSIWEVFNVCFDNWIGWDSEYTGGTMAAGGGKYFVSLVGRTWSVGVARVYIRLVMNHIWLYRLRLRVANINYMACRWVFVYYIIFHDRWGVLMIGSKRNIWVVRVKIDR